ncbi:MAG: thioredoxin family protein [Eubacteriales bacterium]|nr:thioredoxin family protein [Eubacteriales bacterium]
MKEIWMFHLPNCPYCLEAKRYVEEVRREDPAYAAAQIRMIDEAAEGELASQYDYYYVPSFYVDGKKMHEGAATKDQIRAVLKAAK